MGDISEMRGLIVLFTIVALTISLIVLIPAQFFTPEDSINEPYSPDADVLDLIAWNSTYVLNMTYGAGFQYYDFELNGYNFVVTTFEYNSDDWLAVSTYAKWWVFEWDRQDFTWYNSGVKYSEEIAPTLTYQAINDTKISNDTFTFSLKNKYTSTSVTCVWNSSAYASFDAAYEDDAASLVFNVDWNDRNTGMNALQLVGMVLTGSLPNMDPALSVVFAMISWGLVAAGVYLGFIFVLRIVGAVFGGGGA